MKAIGLILFAAATLATATLSSDQACCVVEDCPIECCDERKVCDPACCETDVASNEDCSKTCKETVASAQTPCKEVLD